MYMQKKKEKKRREDGRTESKDTFVGHVRRTTDHVPRVALGQLVVADIEPVHPAALELCQHSRDLLRAGGRLELEGEEDLRAARGVVPVYEFRHRAGVYDRV